MSSAPPGAGSHDPSTLPPVLAHASLLRLVDPDDIEGWSESEQRWVLGSKAIQTEHLIPGGRSGYGCSFYVQYTLVSLCGASTTHEIHFLQRHAKNHPCTPSWQEGLVGSVNVDQVLALGLGAVCSPDDGACDETRKAHASVWRVDPMWKKGRLRAARDALLKLLGSNTPYEDADRVQERINARTSLLPGSGPTSGSGSSGTP